MNKRTAILLMLFTLSVSLMAHAGPSTPNRARGQALQLWQYLSPEKLKLKSHAALVVDDFGNELFAKRAGDVMPIASITKLMTAMVVLDSKLPLDEELTVSKEDRDLLRLTASRLKPGAKLTRGELLTLMLMSSENRAAAALARSFPGETTEFVRRMNLKAKTLGLYDTTFGDASGLDPRNVSTAHDLARMVRAAQRYPEIHAATTQSSAKVKPYSGKGALRYVNTNRLVRSNTWEIQVSKTGYLNEAGRCLVMVVDVKGKPIVLVLLNSFGKLTPVGDANRIRKWIEAGVGRATRVADAGSARDS